MKTHFHPLCVLWAQKATLLKKESKWFLSLENINPKILYSASRPKKFRNFMLTEQFLTLWTMNEEAFIKEPPEVGLVYSNMPKQEGIAHAIAISLSHPQKQRAAGSLIPRKSMNCPKDLTKTLLFSSTGFLLNSAQAQSQLYSRNSVKQERKRWSSTISRSSL